MQRQKALKWWECSVPVKGTFFFEKYLKTMEMFNFLDLHHRLAISRGTPKSWWASSERSSSRVGRMIAPKSHSPMIALNSSIVGHNSTPLNWKTWRVGIQNSVATHRRGSSTLVWWMWEVQKRPRGMGASLKLGLSLLTYKETSSAENFAIGNLKDCRLGSKLVSWRFRDFSQLFYSKKCWLGLSACKDVSHS